MLDRLPLGLFAAISLLASAFLSPLHFDSIAAGERASESAAGGARGTTQPFAQAAAAADSAQRGAGSTAVPAGFSDLRDQGELCREGWL
jgi:hypothetical protein